jgi:hypothetical protein
VPFVCPAPTGPQPPPIITNSHGSTNLPFVFPRFQERSAELQIPRDDKKGRVVVRQGRLLDERAVALSLLLPSPGRRQVIKLTYDQKSLSHISGSSL